MVRDLGVGCIIDTYIQPYILEKKKKALLLITLIIERKFGSGLESLLPIY